MIPCWNISMFVMLAIKKLSLTSKLIYINRPILMAPGHRMANMLIFALEKMELEYIRLILRSFNMIYGLF